MMRDCECCGVQTLNIRKCDPCIDAEVAGVVCNPYVTWHCFTAYCDGSGCSYAGECEE